MKYIIDMILVCALVYFGLDSIANGGLGWVIAGVVEIMLAGSLLTAATITEAERRDS